MSDSDASEVSRVSLEFVTYVVNRTELSKTHWDKVNHSSLAVLLDKFNAYTCIYSSSSSFHRSNQDFVSLKKAKPSKS